MTLDNNSGMGSSMDQLLLSPSSLEALQRHLMILRSIHQALPYGESHASFTKNNICVCLELGPWCSITLGHCGELTKVGGSQPPMVKLRWSQRAHTASKACLILFRPSHVWRKCLSSLFHLSWMGLEIPLVFGSYVLSGFLFNRTFLAISFRTLYQAWEGLNTSLRTSIVFVGILHIHNFEFLCVQAIRLLWLQNASFGALFPPLAGEVCNISVFGYLSQLSCLSTA